MLILSRWIFWTDWGNQARVDRADADGRNHKNLISGKLGWPHCIAVDKQAGRLVWADAKTHVSYQLDSNFLVSSNLLSIYKYIYVNRNVI